MADLTIDFTKTETRGNTFKVNVKVHKGYRVNYTMPDGIKLASRPMGNPTKTTRGTVNTYHYYFVVPPNSRLGDFLYTFTITSDGPVQPDDGTKKKQPRPQVGSDTKTATGTIEVSGGFVEDKQLKAPRRKVVRRRAGRSTRG